MGFSTHACRDGSASEGDRIAISEEEEVQNGVDPERYFYTCVKETYVRAGGVHCPTGYLGARLLGCPEGHKFDAESKECSSSSSD